MGVFRRQRRQNFFFDPLSTKYNRTLFQPKGGGGVDCRILIRGGSIAGFPTDAQLMHLALAEAPTTSLKEILKLLLQNPAHISVSIKRSYIVKLQQKYGISVLRQIGGSGSQIDPKTRPNIGIQNLLYL